MPILTEVTTTDATPTRFSPALLLAMLVVQAACAGEVLATPGQDTRPAERMDTRVLGRVIVTAVRGMIGEPRLQAGDRRVITTDITADGINPSHEPLPAPIQPLREALIDLPPPGR